MIRSVSDTAHWVAMYRALESERPDALFRDPHARRLAGARGEAMLRAMPRGRQWAWPLVVRTAVMDEIILRVIARGGARTVVNLAAGLDARPYRLDLPASLHWIDVDLPALQDHKREALAAETPRCGLEWLPADLADGRARRSVLSRVAAAPKPALAVTEGLLIYLPPEHVAALARDLHACAALQWWLTDLGSPLLVRMLRWTWGRALAAAGAPLRFAPAEGTAFFEPLGWREAEYRSTWEESLRLGRSVPLAGLWSRLGRLYPKALRELLRTAFGMALLARGARAGARVPGRRPPPSGVARGLGQV